jgi:hypothetical protein
MAVGDAVMAVRDAVMAVGDAVMAVRDAIWKVGDPILVIKKKLHIIRTVNPSTRTKAHSI